MEKERIKRIIQYIIVIIIGCIVGYKTTNADTLGVPSEIVFKTTGEQLLNKCNNSDYCYGYNFNNPNPNVYTQVIYNYNFTANTTYYVSFQAYFGFGYGNRYEYSLPENFNGGIKAGVYDGIEWGQYLNCAPTIEHYNTSYGNVYWDDNYVGNSNYLVVRYDCSIKPTQNGSMIAFNVVPNPNDPTSAMFVRESNLIVTQNEADIIINNDNKNHKETMEGLYEIRDVLNSGEYKEPTRKEEMEKLEEEEEILWNEIIGIPNYNDLKIDINENATEKIWEIIERIINQNTAILTMIITILSISIIKLVLSR